MKKLKIFLLAGIFLSGFYNLQAANMTMSNTSDEGLLSKAFSKDEMDLYNVAKKDYFPYVTSLRLIAESDFGGASEKARNFTDKNQIISKLGKIWKISDPSFTMKEGMEFFTGMFQSPEMQKEIESVKAVTKENASKFVDERIQKIENFGSKNSDKIEKLLNERK